MLDKESSYQIDKDKVYDSVLALPSQLASMSKQLKGRKLKEEIKEVDKVVIVGMGGSALGARVIKALAGNELKVPVEIVNDYQLPGFADEKTLVILSSYSGNTEEVINAGEEAKEVESQVLAMTTGGKLMDLAEENDWPVIKINPEKNPSNQPRMAIGYSVLGQIVVLDSLGIWRLKPELLSRTINWLGKQQKKWKKEVDRKNNPAKKLSRKLESKAPILISGEFLKGAVHVFKNQLNENAKTFAVRFDLPELNHHLMEGLGKPESLKKDIHFLLFDSQLYSDKIKKRLAITEEVILKQGYEVTKLEVEGKSKFEQVWEVIQFGGFVSLYLAILHKIDPAPIPWVDYFKKQLKS